MTIVRRRALILPTTCTYRHVSHGSTSSPVSLAILAEMARLVDIIVIIVAELGVHAVTAGTRQYFVWFFEVLIL